MPHDTSIPQSTQTTLAQSLLCLLFFFSCTQESPAACLSSLVLLRRVQTLLHSQADSVRRRGRVRMSTQARTGTGGFRHLSPISPLAHLSAQKMSQTNSVSTCVSFTRCTGARVHGPDRTRHVRSWDGSWEVRNWHLDDLATPTRANNSTRQHKADASFGGIDTAAQAAEAAQWSDATATSGASTLRLRGARSYAVLNESHRSEAPEAAVKNELL